MDRHDAELLLAASGGGLTLDEINPVTLRTPAAPLAAALVEKVNIDIEALLNVLPYGKAASIRSWWKV